jgi:hypothetical protein
MTRIARHLPTGIAVCALLALALHGPIAQLPDYHAFADRRVWLDVPYAADVFSNLGFALVGACGLLRLWPRRRHAGLAAAWPGYAVFLAALCLTAVGSTYYHLAPDDHRLVWDRLPIALACAGLLAGARADSHPDMATPVWLAALCVFAVGGVAWWSGTGDLRPYLLLQGLPLVLIPLWQARAGAPAAERRAFGLAIALYVLAKFAELNDHALFETLGGLAGHTLKHLLATGAAWVLVRRLMARADTSPRGFRLSSQAR